MFSRALVASFAVVLGACGPQSVELGGQEDVLAGDALELSTTELKVATTGMTIWLRPYAVKAVRDGQGVWVLRGRSSVNLESALSYVPDDGFCQTNILSARTFEIVIHGASETNTLLSGLPLFVNLVQAGSKQATLKFVLEARFVDMTGSSKLWLNPELKPIYVSGSGLTYRGKVRATGVVTAIFGGTPAKVSARAGAIDEWNLDVGFDALSSAALTTGAQLTLDQTGVVATKKAVVAFGIKELELQRTPDAYQTWPSATCTQAVQGCLTAAPLDIADYEACGSYRQVSRCNIPTNLPAVGPSPDDLTALTATLASINAALPASKKVKVTSFWVQGWSSARPTITQAMGAWKLVEPTATALDGERTPGQLNIDLDGYAARALVPAIQKTVFQQSFKVMRLKSPQTSWHLLYFSTAGRLVVVQLIDSAS